MSKFFFVCLWTETKLTFINTQKGKKEVNIQPSYPQAWSIKDLLYGIRNKFLLRDISRQFRAGKIASSVQGSAILPAKRASHIMTGSNNLVLLVSASTALLPNNTSPPGILLCRISKEIYWKKHQLKLMTSKIDCYVNLVLKFGMAVKVERYGTDTKETKQ